MAILLDPENNETAALFEFASDLDGACVLEVGCGDGRLTWLYAHRAAHVTGIDPDGSRIERAMAGAPLELRSRLAFHTASLEEYYASRPPTDRFDLAILSWSL